MLQDHLAPDMDILFCGTAAGRASAARGHYYAGPGNRFWQLLHEIGITPRQMTPEEDHLMPSLGLGLTDLAKDVAGMDKDIPAEAYLPDRLAQVITDHRPKAVAFTSLNAARLALGDKSIASGPRQDARWPGITLWALSSPSRANGHFSDQSWHALGQWRKALQ